MTGMQLARQAVADAVTAAGLPCAAYAPDAPTLPAAWVDMVSVAYDTGAEWATYCRSGVATLSVVTAAMRNDQQASGQDLEGLPPMVDDNLSAAGASLQSWQTGLIDVNGQSVPALIYKIQLGMG